MIGSRESNQPHIWASYLHFSVGLEEKKVTNSKHAKGGLVGRRMYDPAKIFSFPSMAWVYLLTYSTTVVVNVVVVAQPRSSTLPLYLSPGGKAVVQRICNYY